MIIPGPEYEILILLRAGSRIQCQVYPVYVTKYNEYLVQAFAGLLQILLYVFLGHCLADDGQSNRQDLLVAKQRAVLEILSE